MIGVTLVTDNCVILYSQIISMLAYSYESFKIPCTVERTCPTDTDGTVVKSPRLNAVKLISRVPICLKWSAPNVC